MNEMIERIAREICWAYQVDPDSKSHVDGNAYRWEDNIDAARAAIVAMREPTAAILKVIEDELPADGHDVEFVKDEAPDYWRALIDAALEG